MSRMRQRRFHNYVESAAVTREPAINNLSFGPGIATTLAGVNARGFWLNSGGLGFDQLFLPGDWMIDPAGYLIDNETHGANIIGEFYNGLNLEYTNQICSSRILRSEFLIEYWMARGMAAAGSEQFNIRAFNPQISTVDVYTFQILNAVAAVHTLTETTIPLGAVGAAFPNERGAVCNKIKISAVRVAAGQKNLVVNWWSYGAGAMQTTTLNHIAGGAGDVPIMWSFNLPVTTGLLIKRLEVSNVPIVYGGAPV